MTNGAEEKLRELYGVYNNTIKLLIAKIEAKLQKFPIEIFNEIRAFNDHVARCYLPPEANINHDAELSKAEAHIVRITLDCYKFLNVIYFKDFEEFYSEEGKNINYKDIESGRFIKDVFRLKAEAEKYSEEARIQESINKGESLKYWQEMHVAYSKLFKYITDNQGNIVWAKDRFKEEQKRIKRRTNWSRFWDVAKWVLTIILSWILGHFSSPYIKDFFDKNINGNPKIEVIDKDNSK